MDGRSQKEFPLPPKPVIPMVMSVGENTFSSNPNAFTEVNL
jgi:hypothetical protein